MLFVLLMFSSYVFSVCYAEEKSIDDFVKIFGTDSDILEIDNMFVDFMRSIGEFIYKILSTMLDGISNAFLSVAKWDIFSIPALQEVQNNLQLILPSFIIVLLAILFLIKIFVGDGLGKAIKNVLIVSVLICIFGETVSLIRSTKNTLIDVSSEVATIEKDTTVSKEVYKNSTYDIWYSLQKGKPITLNDIPNFDFKYYQRAERLKRNQLREYYTYNDDGSTSKEKLTDGVMGYGDVRYYRYHTDYMAVNFTLLFSFIIYFLAIFKMGYLLWEELQIIIFGSFAILRGFFNESKIASPFISLAKNSLSIVILTFSMILYTVVANGVMTSTTLDTFWLIKPIITFSMGLCIVVGSGYLANEIGLDDGSNHVMKSMFVTRSIARFAGKTVDMFRHGVGDVIGALDKGGSMLNKGMDQLNQDPIDPLDPNSPTAPSYPSAPYGSVSQIRERLQNEQLENEKANPNSSYWKEPSTAQYQKAYHAGISLQEMQDKSAGQLDELIKEKGVNNFTIARNKILQEQEQQHKHHSPANVNRYESDYQPKQFDWQSPSASWRDEPITQKQIYTLKKIWVG